MTVPIPADSFDGDPESLYQAAAKFRRCRDWLLETARYVRGLDATEWSGAAADNFRDVLFRHGQTRLRAADSCDLIAREIDEYAASLAEIRRQVFNLRFELQSTVDPLERLSIDEMVQRLCAQRDSLASDAATRIRHASDDLDALPSLQNADLGHEHQSAEASNPEQAVRQSYVANTLGPANYVALVERWVAADERSEYRFYPIGE